MSIFNNKKTNSILIGSIVLILLMTLYPFNFSIDKNMAIDRLNGFTYIATTPGDLIANIFLFIPFGLSLNNLLDRQEFKWYSQLVLVLFASTILSLSVEISQAFLPTRVPAYTDLITNSLGGILGFLCLQIVKLRFSRSFDRSRSTSILSFAFILYLAIILILSFPVKAFVSLTNWQENFPLVLGNEATGDRPWSGKIDELYISGRAFSQDEIKAILSGDQMLSKMQDSAIAYYQLNSHNYQDMIGNSPDLLWQGNQLQREKTTNNSLDQDLWLSTQVAASFISKKISQSSQFTIITIVATNNLQQIGPSRIVSLSGDYLNRNFTIAQEKSDLVFRLRTFLTGDNGSKPEIIVPNIFTDTESHRLLITYTGSLLNIYIDRLDNNYDLELTPATVISSYLVPIQTYRLPLLKFICYGIIFVPIGILLALIRRLIRRQFISSIWLIAGGIFFPAFFLEGIYLSNGTRNINFANIILSVLIVIISMVAIEILLQLTKKKNAID